MRLQRTNSVHHFFRLFWCAVGVYRWVESEECGTPSATEHLLWGAFHVERGVGCFGVPAEQDFVGALLFETLKPLI